MSVFFQVYLEYKLVRRLFDIFRCEYKRKLLQLMTAIHTMHVYLTAYQYFNKEIIGLTHLICIATVRVDPRVSHYSKRPAIMTAD